ncbi:MAG: carbohydrate ABC transporter permease [Clostridiales bacterium]
MKMPKDRFVFNIIGYFYISIFSLFCLIPFIMVISGSITNQNEIIKNGYNIIPSEISFEAYKIVFKSPDSILRSYGITIFVTVIGTIIGLLFTSMAAYVLSCKEFKYRNYFSFFFYFTTVFSGGIVPWYIVMVRYLNLKNTVLALILPLLLNVFYIIIMKTFMKSIPDAIGESAKMDGAGDFRIFFSLILPLSKPALATIGLFIALNYWNDWFNTMLFIDNDKLYNLQYFLYQILSKLDFMNAAASQAGVSVPSMPSESFKLAMTVVVTGPIVFLYPFVQKYFIRGITVGSVKG